MDRMIATALERQPGQTSKVVGLYQMLLRRSLEHFFPEAVLEPAGDRSFIGLGRLADRPTYWFAEDPDGLGIQIGWFGTRYLLQPGGPNPFLPSERQLVGAILRVVDHRFRGLFDPEWSHREDLFQYAIEDQVVAESLGTPDADRVPPALERCGSRPCRRTRTAGSPPGCSCWAPSATPPSPSARTRPGRPGTACGSRP